jgi:hypothetical protein
MVFSSSHRRQIGTVIPPPSVNVCFSNLNAGCLPLRTNLPLRCCCARLAASWQPDLLSRENSRCARRRLLSAARAAVCCLLRAPPSAAPPGARTNLHSPASICERCRLPVGGLATRCSRKPPFSCFHLRALPSASSFLRHPLPPARCPRHFLPAARFPRHPLPPDSCPRHHLASPWFLLWKEWIYLLGARICRIPKIFC